LTWFLLLLFPQRLWPVAFQELLCKTKTWRRLATLKMSELEIVKNFTTFILIECNAMTYG
jgi:hypothetical protein